MPTEPTLRTENLDGIEVFSVGTFNGDSYTESDLDAMCDAYGKVGFKPPVKLGHSETQKLLKGEELPAAGWVENLRRAGSKLIADFRQVPKVIADIIRAGGLKRTSAEIYWDYGSPDGQKYPRVLKAVALLGASIPAVTSLKDIVALYAKEFPGQWSNVKGRNHPDQHAPVPVMYDSDGRPFKPVLFGDGTEPDAKRNAYGPPQKFKTAVNYRDADEEDEERCGTCRYFLAPQLPGPMGMPQSVWNEGGCTLVEGGIAAEAVCDLFEERLYQATTGIERHYVIEKRDGKFCLISKSTGKTLGCHETREGAEAQERAVQASKHAADAALAKANAEHVVKIEKVGEEFCLMRDGKQVSCYPDMEAAMKARGEMADLQTVRFSLEEVKAFCPSCADKMAFLNLKELKLEYDPQTKTYAGFNQGMCDRFGEAEGFRTRCMDSSLADKVKDVGAFCNALKGFCFGTTKETTTQRPARTAGNGAEGGATMNDKSQQVDLTQTITDLEAQLAGVKAQAGDQVKAMEEQIKRYKAATASDAALKEARIKDLERQLATDQEAKRKAANEGWIAKMTLAPAGTAPKLLPVEKPRVEYLLDVLTQLPNETKMYSYQGGEEQSPADVLKALFEGRDSKRLALFFKEISTGNATANAGKGEAPGDPSVLVDMVVKEYMQANKGMTYAQAIQAVSQLEEHKELFARYTAVPGRGR